MMSECIRKSHGMYVLQSNLNGNYERNNNEHRMRDFIRLSLPKITIIIYEYEYICICIFVVL